MSGGIAYCRECGAEINPRAEICPECGIRQKSPERSGMSPGIPAAASVIIPGLGQVVNGQLAKGIILGIVTTSFALTGIGLIIALPIWLWLVYDAYNTADDSEPDPHAEAETRRVNAAVFDALDWYIDEHDAPDTKRVRRRFDFVADISTLTDDELTALIEAIDAYQEQVESKPALAVRANP